jgi:hypothetical protein
MTRAIYGHYQRSRCELATLADGGAFLMIEETTPVASISAVARGRIN